jgi:hypothetical protein
VEFWPTSAIRAAGHRRPRGLAAHRAAIKRDPFGPHRPSVEEVLETARPYGVSKALTEVLGKAREHLEVNERAEVSRHIRELLDRSGLGAAEFASPDRGARRGVHRLAGRHRTPPATLISGCAGLSDRFARIRAQRAAGTS